VSESELAIFTVVLAVRHAPASVTVSVYVPGVKPVTAELVKADGAHAYVKGADPSVTTTLAVVPGTQEALLTARFIQLRQYEIMIEPFPKLEPLTFT
jgi:hypothetical protein